MWLLDKLIFFNFLKTFLGTTFTLTVLMTISMVIDSMKVFVETKQSNYEIYLYIFYSLPKLLSVVFTPSTMFSSCFVISQLNVNKELLAIITSGVSFFRTIKVIFIFNIFFCVLFIFFNEFVVKVTNKMANNQMILIKGNSGNIKNLVYQYHVKGLKGFYYIHYYDRENQMIKGGFHYIEQKKDGSPVFVVSAETAKYNKETKKWILKEVEEILFDDKIEIQSLKKFEKKKYNFPENDDYFKKIKKNVEEMNFLELEDEILLRKKKGLPYFDLIVEKQAIFAFPFMNIIVFLIGCFTGSLAEKSSGVISLGITIIVFLIYYIVYSIFKSLGDSGQISPYIAVWITPFIFLMVTLFFFKKTKF